ncbi:hypothetical protein PJP10_10440 [Mycobacterium kansasii]
MRQLIIKSSSKYRCCLTRRAPSARRVESASCEMRRIRDVAGSAARWSLLCMPPGQVALPDCLRRGCGCRLPAGEWPATPTVARVVDKLGGLEIVG